MFSNKGSKLQAEEQRLTELINNLNNLLKSTSSNYANSDNFYAEYGTFLAQLSNTFQDLKQYAAHSTNAQTQAQEGAKTRAAEFSKSTEEINAQIATRRNELTNLQAQVKEITDRFQPKLWAKLKVKETPALTELFTNLFQTYYPEQNLDWATFKKTEVEKNKLVEFNNRLVNADYTTVAAERIDALDYLRNNTDLGAAAAKKDGAQITELINFLGLVRSISDAQRNVAQLQAQSQGLRTDFEASEKAGVADHGAHQKRNEYLTALNDRMTQSAAPFANIERTTNEMRQAYDEHKRNLTHLVSQVEAQAKAIVPDSVYTA